MDFILFIVFICIPILSLVVFLFYKGIQILRRNGHKRAAIIAPILMVAIIVYTVYRDFYPSNKFYKEVFKTEFGIPVPDDAKILDKVATDYDHFGYSACFAIKLGREEYDQLLIKFPANLSKDSILTDDSQVKIMKKYQYQKIAYVHHVIKEDGYLSVYLIFFDDHKTVICSRFVRPSSS